METLEFPRYNENVIGQLIRECLAGKRGDFMQMDARIASTLFATDRFETKPKIESWLTEGNVVILDRYTSSNMLHQGAKIENAEKRKETIEWIYNLEHTVFGLPVPDVLLYLDVPAEERLRLHEADEKKSDVAEKDMVHQHYVDERASSIMEVYQNTYKIQCMSGITLRSPEDIHEEIYMHLDMVK